VADAEARHLWLVKPDGSDLHELAPGNRWARMVTQARHRRDPRRLRFGRERPRPGLRDGTSTMRRIQFDIEKGRPATFVVGAGAAEPSTPVAGHTARSIRFDCQPSRDRNAAPRASRRGLAKRPGDRSRPGPRSAVESGEASAPVTGVWNRISRRGFAPTMNPVRGPCNSGRKY
jgi:hypothetical protein